MKHTLILSLSLIILGCSTENIVQIKDDEGRIRESYQITKDSVKNGIYKAFYESGDLFEESNFIDGIQEGQRTIFYESGGKEIEEMYKSSLLNGDYKVYYESGKLKIEALYVNNEIKGKLKKYYETGQLMEDVSYSNNEENGPFIEYWENGNLKWEGSYRFGDNEYGELKKYDEQGVLIRKLMCDSLAVCRTFWTLAEDGNNE